MLYQVAAAVVLRPGWAWRGYGAFDAAGRAVTPALLQQHCRSMGLTPYKLPRYLVALPSLPRNCAGKVLKLAVKQLLVDARHPRSAL